MNLSSIFDVYFSPHYMEEETGSLTSGEEAKSSSRRMDEQRIETTRDISIRPVDVLCGRDKLSFNHGTFN